MARLPLPAVSAPPPSRSGGPPSALGVDAPPTLPTRPTPNPEPTCVDLRYIRPITSNSTWPTPGATDPPGSSDPGPSPASAHSSDEDELARRAEPAGGLWSSPGAGTSDSDDVSFARTSPSRGIAEPVMCVCYGRGTKTRLLPDSARQHPPPRLSRSAIVVRKPQPPPPPPSSPTPPSSFPALAPPRRNSAGDYSTAPLPPPSYPTGPPPPARPTKIAATPPADAALARLVITLPGDHRGAACTYKYLARVGPSQRAVRREALRIVGLERGEEAAVAAAASVRQVTLARDDEVYEVGDLGDDLSGVFADGIPRFFVDVRLR